MSNTQNKKVLITRIGANGSAMLFLNLLEMLQRLHKRTKVEGIVVFNHLNYYELTFKKMEEIRHAYEMNTQEEVYKLKLMLYYLDPERYEKEAAHLFEWCEICLTDLPYNLRLSHYKMKQP